jgi:Spy/CpxP family protein refolding chaperone
MWQMQKIVLGLVLWTTASTPLMAQQEMPDSIWQMNKTLYAGIMLTDAQQAQQKEILQKSQQEQAGNANSTQRMPAAKKWEDALYALLTPQQQKVFDRNRQVERLFTRFLGTDRQTIFLGVNPTDAQLAAAEKLLVKEKEEIRASYKSLGEKDDGSFPTEGNYKKANKFRQELIAKNCDAIYALLTPEQQKVAAPVLKGVKAHLTYE